MATAVEAYFNALIDHDEVTSAVITDVFGGTVVECFGTKDADDGLFASNAVISAQRTVTMMEQLRLPLPPSISAQYRGQVLVQHLEESLVVTLVGASDKGHTIGSLKGVMGAVLKAPAVYGCLEAVRRAQ